MSFFDYSLPISLRMLSIVIIILSHIDISYFTMLFVELDKKKLDYSLDFNIFIFFYYCIVFVFYLSYIWLTDIIYDIQYTLRT